MSRQFDTLVLTTANGLQLGPSAAGHTIATLGAATVTHPDASGIIVTDSGTAVLSNKTITDPSNNVAANQLQTSTGAPVNVAPAAAPVAGQVLTATGATAATWQMPSTNGLIASTGTGTGSGATPVVLETFATSDNTIISIHTGIAGRRTDVADTGAGIGLFATYRRGVGAGSLARVAGFPDDIVRFVDNPQYSATTAPNTTTGAITLSVTAAAGHTATWRSSTTTQVI